MGFKSREAALAYHKRWREENRERRLAHQRQLRLERVGWKADEHRRQRYGVTGNEYQRLVDEQGGTCAICRRPPEKVLHIDHDHKTGLYRGLLCRRCNRSIGLFEDDPCLLRLAAEYLENRRNAVLRRVG